MARVETTNLKMGMWTDGENPGAGTQNQSAVGTGLNDNWKIIDNALGAAHNPDGSHKCSIIDAVHLKSTVGDGSTIVQDAGTKRLKIADGGVGAAQIAAGAVSGPALAASSVGSEKIAAGAVTARELDDDAVTAEKILAGNVGTDQLADDAVVAAKLEAAVRILTGITLFGHPTEAATTVNAVAAAGAEWQENAPTDLTKVRCIFFKHVNLKFLRLYGRARISDPGQSWTVSLALCDPSGSVVGSVSANGTNTVYGATPEVALALDISALSAGVLYEVSVKMRSSGGSATAFLKQVNVTATM